MNEQNDEVDLDNIIPSAPPARSAPVPKEEVKYDIDQARETTRLRIAIGLLCVLCVVVAGAMVATGIALWGELRLSEPTAVAKGFDHVKDMTQIVFGPLVALVSAATGFYFGAGSVSPSRQTAARVAADGDTGAR